MNFRPTPSTTSRFALVLAGIALPALLLAQEPLDHGLVHQWRLIENHCQSNRIQPIVGDVSLQCAGSIHFEEASPGAAAFSDQGPQKQFLVLDRSGSGTLDLPVGALTAEAWVRVDQPLEWGGVFGIIEDNGEYERGWLLGYRKSRFFFALATSKKRRLTYLTAPVDFEPGSWYHVVGVWDGKKQSLFIDGTPVATSTEQAGEVVYPEDLQSSYFGAGAYWDRSEYHPLTGAIEQASLWNRALGPSEVEALFENRKSLFPGIEPVHPVVVDWPTHLRDNQRTGLALETALDLPLHLQWTHRARKKPAAAWPPPAEHDFWNRRHNLKPRVTYDRAFPLVASGNHVYYASSSEDKVVCLDVESGRQVWQAFAEGPVRLAPTYHDGCVLFGSDDGCVYCVSANDGALKWKQRIVAGNRQIVGNGRMMSVWPVRSGVLVDHDQAFCCAGLFPEQGIFQVALDMETGQINAKASVGASVQGYLEQKGSRLYAATGRDPAGAFVSNLTRRGKGVEKEVRSIPDHFPFAFIGDLQTRYGGGSGQVAAFEVATGHQVWQAAVDGNAWGMAISHSRLLVSTDEGAIYCFGSNGASAKETGPVSKSIRSSSSPAGVDRLAKAALENLESPKGWALIVNPLGVELTEAITGPTELKVVCLEADPLAARELREQFDDRGLAGRVTVHTLEENGELPYSDYLFNLVMDASSLRDQASDLVVSVPVTELRRVTRPGGGITMTAATPSDTFRRGQLDGIGEWSHQYANPGNTVCSGDQHVAGEMKLQWFGAPGPRGMMDRHHRTAAPLYAAGRIIVPGDNRITVADAYNGTPLWSAEIPHSRRAGVYRDASQLATSGDAVFVAAADECLYLNAADGTEVNRFSLPPGQRNLPDSEWGYVATVDDLLFGSSQSSGATRRDHSREQIEEGTYFDARPLVCSHTLFAKQYATGDAAWQYRPKDGLIINPTIAIAGERVCFLQSTEMKILKADTGRHKAKDLFRNKPLLTVLDMRTGELLWQKPLKLDHIEHAIYVCATSNRIVVHGSFNRQVAGKSRVHIDLAVYDAANGDQLWQTIQNNNADTGGSHGEQDMHPVVVGDRIYSEPFAYHLDTGEHLTDWKWSAGKRRGCGTISASASAFFFRHSHPTMFELSGSRFSKVTTCTRPGCWINMIPAGGLLLIPEASSGCSCDYAVQTSMAFLPTAK